MRRPNDAVPVLIALGSNVGDRQQHLDRAIRALRETDAIRVEAVSRYHETRPAGGPPQADYLNAALAATTTSTPRDLMTRLLAIERAQGRVRTVANGPRTLDLDLILYAESIVDEPGLIIPHPRAHLRRFVLEPAVEVAAEMRHPVLDHTVRELLEHLERADRVTRSAAGGTDRRSLPPAPPRPATRREP